MLLKLIHQQKNSQRTAAALLPGDDPAIWLKQISQWQLHPKQLTAYVVPTSVHDISPAALLVVFANHIETEALDIQYPYQKMAGRLFIPLDADLFPAVSTEELQKLLIWEIQLFHPTIGLVGFTQENQVDWKNLFEQPQINHSDWTKAAPSFPPSPPSPPLSTVSMPRPQAEDVLKGLQGGIGSKPLDELGKGIQDAGESVNDLLARAGQAGLSALFSATEGLKNALGEGTGEGPGLLDKLQGWLGNNMEELEKKRDSEINRLLKLFETNMEEALRYAIPLGSRYFDRGSAPPGWRLGRNNTDFSLGGLGGGGASDVWSLGSRFFDLQKRYRDAANKALAAGKYRQAAYIFAKLLDDFHSAANALEQGKYFREAAILHIEHLKDKPAAARCYEKGGLYLQAIELLMELEQYEKAGDLYMKLEQRKQALNCYGEEARRYIDQAKYIAGAYLYYHKMENPTEAKSILLKAWKDSPKHTDCLYALFDFIYNEDTSDLKDQVQDLFEKLPASHKASFLQLIATLPARYPQADLQVSVQEMGYCLLGEDLAQGRHGRLHLLSKFLPEDQLVASDTSRFMRSRQQMIQKKPYAKHIQLEKETDWLLATSKFDQFVAIGRDAKELVIARGNWFGDIVYQKWPEQDHITLLFDDPKSDQIWAFGNFNNFPEWLHFERNLFFKQRISLRRPSLHVEGLVSMGVKDSKQLRALRSQHGTASLLHISTDNELLADYSCQTDEGAHIMLQPTTEVTPLFYHKNWNYALISHLLMVIGEQGKSKIFPLEGRALKMKVLPQHNHLEAIIQTEKGCLYARLEEGDITRMSEYFARDMQVCDFIWVGSGRMVVAEIDQVKLFDLNEGAPREEAILLKPYEVNREIIAVLSTARQDQVAVVFKGGGISVLEL